jgi:type II secretory pathway predicted ATPase ExeA
MPADKLLSLYGLKFNPCRPGVPPDALYVTAGVDAFCRRVELTIADGGFAMVTGVPGSGKSDVLRIAEHRLSRLPDVTVRTIDRPQSGVSDFYRELGEMYGLTLSASNRWGGFKALRSLWSNHISQSLTRPILIIDEAQEMQDCVFSELRLLTSKDFDSRSLLCVVFAGDQRLTERLKSAALSPLDSRIRKRLLLGSAQPDELASCLEHLLEAAGNPALMSPELKRALAEHAAGNYRVMMIAAEELLAVAADRELPRLDEQLFFEVFRPPTPPRNPARKR